MSAFGAAGLCLIKTAAMSLAADLVDTGVNVRLVLPGAIDTEIWDQPDNDPADYNGPLAPADEVASGILAAIDSPNFEHYVPDMRAVVEMKTKDFDGFVAAMRSMSNKSVSNKSVDES